jgi:hypothetical protein
MESNFASCHVVSLLAPCWRGISLLQTESTTAELELDQNLNFDFTRLQEKGRELEPLFGPGYTGLSNLGNRWVLQNVALTPSWTPQTAAAWVCCVVLHGLISRRSWQ